MRTLEINDSCFFQSQVASNFDFATSLGLGTHLFVKLSRPGDSEGTYSLFEEAALKGRGNPVKCLALPNDTTSELAGLSSL